MKFADMFRKKSISQIQADAAAGFSEEEGSASAEGKPSLSRSLGVFDLTMMGIAAIIGAGIFGTIGTAAYEGGPAVILLFIFTGITCGFAALCYCEFASRLPVAGSAYSYSYASLGEIVAWIIGWDLLVEYAIGNIAVAISWSDYFTSLLKANELDIPAFLTMDYWSALRGFTENKEVVEGILQQGFTLQELGLKTADQLTDISNSLTPQIIEAYMAWTSAPRIFGMPVILDLPALFIVIIITILVYFGIRKSTIVSNVMVGLKLGVILLVIILGGYFVKTANWLDFMPNGFGGVMSGVSAVFFAFIGFDALSTTAEECKNPYKDLPRGMIYSLVICTILYIILALILTGMVSYTQLNVADPLAYVFKEVNLPWVSGIIAVSAIIAMASVLLVFQIGQPRLWMAMSRDGLLPKIFSSIHPKFKTPWFSTILTGCMVTVPLLFMSFKEILDLTSIGTLFAFILVCAGVLVKDKEFGRENRFVPYINSRFIAPVLFTVLLLLVVYFNGVSVLNEKEKSEVLRISTESLKVEPQSDKYSAFDIKTLTNGSVISEGFKLFTNFFNVEITKKEWQIKIVTPKSQKIIKTSKPKDKIVFFSQTGEEKAFPVALNEAEAKGEPTYMLLFLPSGQKVTMLNKETMTVSTPKGDAEVSMTMEKTEESWVSAFSHKIPHLVFFIFTVVMMLFCLIKRFSLIPVLGMMSCAYLMTALGIASWTRLCIWLIIGLVVYFVYGFWNSKLLNRETSNGM